MSKANTVIPKPIQWKDITLPDEWILEGATQPVIPKQLEPNTELQNVTQYSYVHILFFYWFEMHASDNNINYPFKESNPITVRKKTAEWNLSGSGRIIESEHPPLRSLTIEHGEPPFEIKASPYKIHKDPDTDLDSIIQQNNFCNANLNTIGKQLTRIESQFQKSTVIVPSSTPSKSDSLKKLKKPIFKPFQVSKHSQKLVQESKSDFTKAIKEQLDRIEASSFASTSKVQIAPDSAQSSKIGVLEQDQSSIASSDIEAFKDESIPKTNKIHWELALPTVRTPPDLTIDNRPSALNQSCFNASSVYEWNIDGMSEYNVLGVLQQMTMVANAYKTQSGTSDKAIAEILIVDFIGQLKGWWGHLLTK
ncbi:Integrase catalytic domain-containing protein [Citrus sinensis]|uniref:Integrase catalytic domain-containing protein n=1 Tax=Citrus sinensis TaxID=2711 RepID=A0ACB8IHC5_CITSI|nr:Integrase catalytic domain-containing protein [Citrus sinensis]